MRHAVFSDAHGNKPYFDLCLGEMERLQIDRFIFLGDIFGYMNDGKRIMDVLRKKNAFIIKGNHEAMLLGELDLDEERDKIYGLRNQKKKMCEEEMDYLRQLPNKLEWKINTGTVLFVHGAPFDELNGYLYEDNADYSWKESSYRHVFMGHTHRPFIKESNGTVFVNVGSCGLPRDHGREPSFAVFDDESGEVMIRRIHVAKEILSNDYYENVNEKVLSVLRRE